MVTETACVFGLEHLKIGNEILNLTATILPYRDEEKIPHSLAFLENKHHFAPAEKCAIEKAGFKCKEKNDGKNNLYNWKGIKFPVYCCYDLTSIKKRAEHIGDTDIIFVIEYNPDTNLFDNIVSSLTRDLYSYVVQVNTNMYGD
jgi:hypothetical protein